MFERRKALVAGILLDFDNSSPVDDDGNAITSGAKQRTGTAPFMASDLLSKEPLHLYRHDLESFLFVLVWASVHFDLQNKCRLPNDAVLQAWNVRDVADFEPAQNAKRAFLMFPDRAEVVWKQCRPEFQPLLETWLKPLRAMFAKGISASNISEDDDPFVDTPNVAFDNSTLGGHVTYEKFMTILRRSR